MKRFLSFIVASAFLLGSVVCAQAVDVKVKGYWDFVFGWDQNTKFADNSRLSDSGGRRGSRDNDNFVTKQRIRTQVDFIASENLSGVLMFEIGTLTWGRGGSSGRSSGGQLDADGVNVETKRAYLDWVVPNTDLSIRMGIQGIYMPMATRFNSPVMNTDVAGIVANYKIDDMFSVTAFWARPFDQFGNDSSYKNDTRSLDDEMDLFGLILPVDLDGVRITPWGMWGRIGSASGFYEYYKARNRDSSAAYGLSSSASETYNENSSSTVWWAGTGVAVTMFDPLTFAIDAMYGRMQRQQVYTDGDTYLPGMDGSEIGTSGWFVAATLDYKLEWGVVGLFGWWSTGDTEAGVNSGKLGRMPQVSVDTGFNPTSFGFGGGAVGLSTDTVIGRGVGNWGVGLQVADLSFIEDLRHTIRVAYYQGTNDNKVIKDHKDRDMRLSTENMYLTDKDHAIEVNFDHTYKIYENLTGYLQLAYINLDLDKSTWNNSSMYGTHKTDDAWKAEVILRYEF